MWWPNQGQLQPNGYKSGSLAPVGESCSSRTSCRIRPCGYSKYSPSDCLKEQNRLFKRGISAWDRICYCAQSAAPALESPPSTLIWPPQHFLVIIMRHSDPTNVAGQPHARQSDRECVRGAYLFFGTRMLILLLYGAPDLF